MNCLHPTIIKSPETRLLAKCIKEQRSFEYYYHHANVRRNLLLDPTPLVEEPYEYYALTKHLPSRQQRVPCGKCDNCIKRKVNDYFVKSYFEWKDCSFSGTTYFLTLTFAPELLPHYNGHECFDSEYIKKFMKRFRVYLERNGIYDGEVRYFFVSEFGGEFGRPHHHGLLFLHNFLNTPQHLFQIKEAVACAWTKFSDRKDWYANVELDLFDCQRVDVQVVQSSRQIKYVSKYIGKQLGCDDFYLLNLPYRYNINHWQSLGFGDCITKYCQPDLFKDGLVMIDDYKYPLPYGLQVKLKREFYCYSDNGDIIFQPTAFARDSVRDFTFNRLEEYKKLSLINNNFPEAPYSLRDPNNLELLRQYLDKYNGFVFSHDFSGNDLSRFGDVRLIVEDVQDYFERVDDFYRPKYEAQAYKFREHQKNRFLKKKNLK